ncbi:HlyC/CorC family transporter [Microbulbifer thermotolerans]|uniref:HlyC/CorC family transporter n=1 Tax=Microbulbifer thermotolerans TaxID=252514 RepID=A0A143HL43_MICTH|nr:HlyC/CorC family transporter [Microbulbifer thermotolerans]AMX02231.1 magnesium/cobalt efflux protein [Microbulbifer thermotolerans]MCX2778793.1 HlyC/CorC family transporter [Microbulbifer thermotolerans]MCX2781935.1 HlyC/CorC family transporter [Microbulbifer thermotolerans]MCX2793679.1 HlyC/CorC family transporter [Microbulbifer thermotolerans]MCX2800863.1 HlyC/CorC family transporter [Microbulbifer thermotolerans]
MNEIPLGLLFGLLALLIVISAFFSSSETSMMALNRYRLRHQAKSGHRGAKRAMELLSRPDKLIGVILIGNNLVNILASVIAGVVFTQLYGDAGVIYATAALTIVILIFAEVTPKTVAALRPEKIAFPASLVLRPLLWLLAPLVWLVSSISNGLARLVGVEASAGNEAEHLAPEELRTVVFESGALLPKKHKGMLLNVLDLDQATVEDIMIPRNEVTGVDLESTGDEILQQLAESSYTRLPVYRGDINRVVGILHLRRAAQILRDGPEAFSAERLQSYTDEPYFVPEATPLPTLLMNFQKKKRRMGLVVDEYGEVMGIVTLEDLLEEIVGDFTTSPVPSEDEEIVADGDDWYLIEGGTSIRDINRTLQWDLPTDGPKTLNGLAMEYLESIPDGNISFYLQDYLVEIVEVSDKMITRARAKKVR